MNKNTMTLRRLCRSFAIGFLLLGAVASTASSLPSGIIQFTIPDTTAKKGDTLLIPIRVSSIATTDSIYSGQFTLSFNAGVLNVYGIEIGGSLLNQGSVSVLYNTTTRRLAFASSSLITGSGVLVYLKVAGLQNPSALTDSIKIPSAILNEGNPTASIDNGYFRYLNIAVSPKNPPTTLVVGDSLQFSVNGDQQLPLSWTSSNPSVATIDQNGKLRAVGVGQLKVFVNDARGLADSTNLFPINSALLRSLTLMVRDTSFTQTLEFNLPIYMSDVTGLGIIAGQFSLTYNANLLQAIDVMTAGSATSTWSAPSFQASSGRIDIALAGTQPLSGSGVLVYVRFRVGATASGSTTVAFSNVLFNESINATTVNGTFFPLAAPTVVIAPNTAILTRGDTLRFNVTSGGTPAYTWSSTNPAVASINPSTGLLTALARGTTNVRVVDSFSFSATTGSIVVNDIRVSLPDTLVGPADSLDVPLFTENVTGLGVLSYELRITYNRSVVLFSDVVLASTMSSGYTVSVKDTLDTLRIASAGSTALAGSGVLAKLRFRPAPTATIGQSSNLNFVFFRFNEPGPSTPTATFLHGRLSIGNLVPPIPTLLSPLDGAVDVPINPTLSWNVSATATHYRLQVSKNALFDTLMVDSTGIVGTSLNVTGLSNSTLYYWRVAASNAGGSSAFSPPRGFTTVIAPPVAPSLIMPVDSAANVPVSPTLSWNATPGATDYTLQLSLSIDFTSLVLDQSGIASTSYSVSGLLNDTVYYWRASARNTGGTGPFSAPRMFRTVVAAPAIPALESPADGATGVSVTPTLRWLTASRATSYRVQVSTDTSFSVLVIDQSNVADTSLTTPTLANGTQYVWRVSAINVGGSSAFSVYRTVTTVLAAPQLLSPVDGAMNVSTAPTFSWTAATGATSYTFQLSLVSDFSTFVVNQAGIIATSHAASGLVFSTVYYWRVSASKGSETSPFSTVRSFTTTAQPPPPPAVPTLSVPANGATGIPVNTILGWVASEGATSYRLQVSTQSDFSTLFLDQSDIATTAFAVAGLNFSTQYSWRVGASNASGFSGFSAPFSFTTVHALPTATTISPNSGSRGDTLAITITGTGFVGGVTAVSFGADVTVDSVRVTSPTQLTVWARISITAALGAHSVSVINAAPGGGTATLVNSFTVGNPIPTILSVLPSNGARGQSLTVTIAGTKFVSGLAVSFGAGITVDSLIVVSAVQLSVHIRIDSTASGGPVTVTVTNPAPGGGVASLPNAFSVLNPVPTLVSIAPTSGSRGESAQVLFNGTNFLAGISSVGLGPGINIHAVDILSGVQMRATVSIDTNAVTGPRSVSVSNSGPGGGVATLSNAFTVTNPVPTLTSITPDRAGRGSVLNVIFTGTGFFTDATEPSFATGITVNSKTVLSFTSMQVNITVSPTAAAGSVSVSVTNNAPGGGTATLPNAFTIDLTPPTAVEQLLASVPTEFVLTEPFPNPFNPVATIGFGVPVRSTVKIEIVNLLGRTIEKLLNEQVGPGSYRTVWAASHQASGVYLVRMEAVVIESGRRFVASRKVVLMK